MVIEMEPTMVAARVYLMVVEMGWMMAHLKVVEMDWLMEPKKVLMKVHLLVLLSVDM